MHDQPCLIAEEHAKYTTRHPAAQRARLSTMLEWAAIMSILSDPAQMDIIERVGERPSLLGCAAHVGPSVREYPASHSHS